ncbi:MAG: flagellar hook-basal body complex protein FliE [Desulfobacterales bacterium]|jgi:flagellar hook-basal body complex protein FliE|nr:flagellar hook-basal body complex protein FliE [Desulfobacterales bacterium]
MNGIEWSSGIGAGTLLPKAAESRPAAGGESFGSMLQSSLDKVGRLQAEADRSLEDLTTGRQADIHTTMIAMEKAEVAFELALQVRNKLLNAYETLMRQPI